jgi:hypothetical protein
MNVLLMAWIKKDTDPEEILEAERVKQFRP